MGRDFIFIDTFAFSFLPAAEANWLIITRTGLL